MILRKSDGVRNLRGNFLSSKYIFSTCFLPEESPESVAVQWIPGSSFSTDFKFFLPAFYQTQLLRDQTAGLVPFFARFDRFSETVRSVIPA